MSNTPETGGHYRAKRLKLSQPRGAHPGLGRLRMSTEGMIEEPVGSRGPPKKSGTLGARGGMRASTGTISTAQDQAQAMLNHAFSPTVDKTPNTVPATPNGASTTPVSDTPHDLSASALARRNVSGPGQYTPRALLKAEDDFEDIGINAQNLLAQRGDYISWWMAECVLRVAEFLEHPQKGAPDTLNARPETMAKTFEGRPVRHCCDKGGIDHLLPCNLKRPPSAKEAFGFAATKRDVLVMEHHASKGGINTIAYVGDIVLDKFIGESKIDEDEFKLLAGSESLRQYYGRGHKRYKAPDPQVDPTKQPILLLKSFKKMAMQEDFVTALKKKYLWVLREHQDLIGEKSPEPVAPLEPSPVPAFAQRAATSTPAVNIAPAPAPAPTPTPMVNHTPVSIIGVKRPRSEATSPMSTKRVTIKKLPETFPDVPLAMSDARMSRRPEFPLRELSDDECQRLTKYVVKIRSLIIEIADPMAVVAAAPVVRPEVKQLAKLASPGRKGSRGRGRKSRASATDQISILLEAAADDLPLKDDDATPDTRLTEPIRGSFSLPVSSKLDGYLKTCIELVVSYTIETFPENVRFSTKAKEVVDNRLAQLEQVVGDIDFRVNTVVDADGGQAITNLYPFLVARLPTRRVARAGPSSPTDQLTAMQNNMEVD